MNAFLLYFRLSVVLHEIIFGWMYHKADLPCFILSLNFEVVVYFCDTLIMHIQPQSHIANPIAEQGIRFIWTSTRLMNACYYIMLYAPISARLSV
jgi:hypothetical protein